MSVFKSLLGSLIGAAIAIGIYFVVKQATGQTFIWFPIVTGVLTGLFASMFMGNKGSNVARYLAGALAGIIAGVAIFGIDVVPTLVAGEAEYQSIDLKDRNDRVQTVLQDSDDKGGDNVQDAGSADSDQTRTDSATDAADDDSSSVDVEGDSDDRPRDRDDESDRVNDSGNTEGMEPDSAETDAADDSAAADQSVGRVDPNQAFKERGIAPERVGGPDNSKINEERFAELIKKQRHQTWYDYWMPYVFAGLGILIAYQLARGFGSASSGSTAKT